MEQRARAWFAHLAKALRVFPGGVGTLDELTEVITLARTKKIERKIPILLYGVRSSISKRCCATK